MAETAVAEAPAVEPPEPEPITGGAELVRALRKSGSPDGNLAPARDALRAAWQQSRGKRALSAAEVYESMEAAGVSPGTLKKAKSLMDTGLVPSKVKTADVRIEDVISPPDEAGE